MEQLGILRLELAWRIISRKFQDGIWVSKDAESIPLEREKGQGYISIDGKMEQYESPWVVLLVTIKKMWRNLRGAARQFVNVTESTMQISDTQTSAIGR